MKRFETNETSDNKTKHVTKQERVLQILTGEAIDEDGWVSRTYILREVWPSLWRDDIRKAKRNLASQICYLRRRGIVTETRSDPWADNVPYFKGARIYIRLANSRAPPGDPE